MKNKWRTLFFFILGINIIMLFIVITLLLLPVKQDSFTFDDNQRNEEVAFNIQTNKTDLNRVINHYLESEGLTGGIHYEVILDEEVELYGTIPVFSQNVSMKLSFEPESLENGDLILRQKTMTIGQLPLPVSYVLKFIKDQYKLPKWVKINPNEELVYVSLHKMKLKSDLKVKVDKFDLRNDKIAFTLLVPTN